jgi:hypothetical protein
MGKRVGKPYDPDIRFSDQGSRLYQTWRKVRGSSHCKEWEDFQTFYDWALESGYEVGDWLRLIDNTGGYTPDNCVWFTPSDGVHPPKDFADKWNKTVNRIRKHYGMPPLEGTNYNGL